MPVAPRQAVKTGSSLQITISTMQVSGHIVEVGYRIIIPMLTHSVRSTSRA